MDTTARPDKAIVPAPVTPHWSNVSDPVHSNTTANTEFSHSWSTKCIRGKIILVKQWCLFDDVCTGFSWSFNITAMESCFHSKRVLNPQISIFETLDALLNSMETTEFEDLGKHCSVVECKLFDFMPFTCDRCSQVLNYCVSSRFLLIYSWKLLKFLNYGSESLWKLAMFLQWGTKYNKNQNFGFFNFHLEMFYRRHWFSLVLFSLVFFRFIRVIWQCFCNEEWCRIKALKEKKKSFWDVSEKTLAFTRITLI